MPEPKTPEIEPEGSESEDTVLDDSPAEEFVVSVYPESDDQYLGLVRGAAMRMKGRGGDN